MGVSRGPTLNRARGDTEPFTLQFNSSGSPVDLSTMTLTMTMSPERNPTDATNQVFSVVATYPNGGSDGLALFTYPSNALNISQGTYYYDVQRVSGGNILTWIKGVVEICQDITKS